MNQLHSPKPTKQLTRYRKCPKCRCKRRFSVKLYEWYGATWICSKGHRFQSE